jgi:hypothetical protein
MEDYRSPYNIHGPLLATCGVMYTKRTMKGLSIGVLWKITGVHIISRDLHSQLVELYVRKNL